MKQGTETLFKATKELVSQTHETLHLLAGHYPETTGYIDAIKSTMDTINVCLDTLKACHVDAWNIAHKENEKTMKLYRFIKDKGLLKELDDYLKDEQLPF